jgi:hypothetical protein
MKNQSDIGARCPCPCTAATFADRKSSLDGFVEGAQRSLFQSISKAFKDNFCTAGLFIEPRSAKASPSQSNQIQLNPTMPPLPGKETGKETVKFLAALNHLRRHSLPDNLKCDNVTIPFVPFNLFTVHLPFFPFCPSGFSHYPALCS